MTPPDAVDQMTIDTPTTKLTTPQLMAALRASFGPEEDIAQRRRHGISVPEILVEEVEAPGTNRRCDLLRIGLWASRGHRIIVHELKTSRSDWLRELAKPEKAEAWWPFCHQFWIVAPAGLIDPGEVPAGWGLMVPPASGRQKRFRVLKRAEDHDPTMTPELLAAIVKRQDNARLAQIAQLNVERQALIDKAVSEVRQQVAVGRLDSRVRARLEMLDKLEAALGAELSDWTWLQDGKLRDVSVEGLATALREYTTDHVAVQARAAEFQKEAQRLAADAAAFAAAYQEQTGVDPASLRARRRW